MPALNPPSWVGQAVAALPRLLPQPDMSSGVTIPANEELDVTAALEKAFAMPVIAVQGTKQPHAGTRGGLILRLTVDSKNASSWWLSTPSCPCQSMLALANNIPFLDNLHVSTSGQHDCHYFCPP